MEKCRGFVLAGGRSRRMGQDKARLDWQGEPLVQWQVRRLRQAVGSCAVIGGNFEDLGLDCVADQYPGEGPLGGILTALQGGGNALVLAVDMPAVSVATLTALAEAQGGDAVIPRHADGKLQPLAAMYRASAAAKLAEVFASGTRRVVEALGALDVTWWEVGADEFRAMNTPAEYAEAART